MENFIKILERIDGIVWGPFMLVLLVGTAIFLTIRTRALAWRNLPYAIKTTLSRDARRNKGHGDVSPFASLCTAMAATIGTGNIAGVADALAIGGPGALVWMWISAAFGCSSKFSECMLAIKYRKTNEKGEMLGGPMVTMERGIPDVLGNSRFVKKFAKFLAVFFAVATAVATFGIGNLTQGNSIAESFGRVMGIKPLVVAFVVGGLTMVVILGGLKSISKVASLIVPVMAVFYFGSTILVILMNVTRVPEAFVAMFKMAFSVRAVGGGIAGTVTASMVQAMLRGVSRGCFSNEAGMGSAAISAAAATSKDQVKTGYISMSGIFWDTFVVCTVTGLAILSSGVMDEVNDPATGQVMLKGAALTIEAFRMTIGPVGAWLVALSLGLFAFSTILGWEYNGEKALEYLTNSTRATFVYRLLYSVVAFVGCISAFEIAWNISDILNALMIIPNVICLVIMSGVTKREMERFQEKRIRSKKIGSF